MLLQELDVVFVKTCTQCLTIYERVQLVPSPEEESVRLQGISLPRVSCTLQSLLGHLSKSTFDRVLEDKSFDLNLFAHLFAQAPPHGSRVAGVDAAPDPDYGLITLYTKILRERVELVPSPEEESVRLQGILLPRVSCTLQSLLGHLSKSTFDRVHEDKSFDLNLFAHLFAQAPPHGSRVAGVDAAPDPDYGLITLYTKILRESTSASRAY